MWRDVRAAHGREKSVSPEIVGRTDHVRAIFGARLARASAPSKNKFLLGPPPAA